MDSDLKKTEQELSAWNRESLVKYVVLLSRDNDRLNKESDIFQDQRNKAVELLKRYDGLVANFMHNRGFDYTAMREFHDLRDFLKELEDK